MAKATNPGSTVASSCSRMETATPRTPNATTASVRTSDTDIDTPSVNKKILPNYFKRSGATKYCILPNVIIKQNSELQNEA